MNFVQFSKRIGLRIIVQLPARVNRNVSFNFPREMLVGHKKVYSLFGTVSKYYNCLKISSKTQFESRSIRFDLREIEICSHVACNSIIIHLKLQDRTMSV